MVSAGDQTVNMPVDDGRVDAASATGSTPPSAAAQEAVPASHRSARASPVRPLLLRRADQAVVALLVAASLVAVAAYWYLRGGAAGRLIEIESAGPSDGKRPANAARAEYVVDINAADWPEFEPLPGVGERLARRIVASREAEGPFRSVDDLARVQGIGAKTVERLRPYLRAGAPGETVDGGDALAAPPE